MFFRMFYNRTNQDASDVCVTRQLFCRRILRDFKSSTEWNICYTDSVQPPRISILVFNLSCIQLPYYVQLNQTSVTSATPFAKYQVCGQLI